MNYQVWCLKVGWLTINCQFSYTNTSRGGSYTNCWRKSGPSSLKVVWVCQKVIRVWGMPTVLTFFGESRWPSGLGRGLSIWVRDKAGYGIQALTVTFYQKCSACTVLVLLLTLSEEVLTQTIGPGEWAGEPTTRSVLLDGSIDMWQDWVGNHYLCVCVEGLCSVWTRGHVACHYPVLCRPMLDFSPPTPL